MRGKRDQAGRLCPFLLWLQRDCCQLQKAAAAGDGRRRGARGRDPTQAEAESYAAEHPELDNYCTANIRVVYFAPAKDRFTGETGDAQLDDMQARADLLMERWTENGGDETAFADLAARYSEHDSAADGGEMDGVQKGTLPESLDSWLFDPARKGGDVTTSVTDDGVWVVYYCSSGASAAVLAAQQQLLDERVEAYLDEQEQSIQVKSSSECRSPCEEGDEDEKNHASLPQRQAAGADAQPEAEHHLWHLGGRHPDLCHLLVGTGADQCLLRRLRCLQR